MSETIMRKFRNLHKGQTMWIVGKGPSLQYLIKEDIGSGPVIAINQAIIKIEELDLPNPVYSMQKDGGDRRRYKDSHPFILQPDCDYKSNCNDKCGGIYRPKKGATLLVHKHESLYCFADYSPRYVFDWMELGLKSNQFSQIIAIKIGLLMGCKKFHFVSFDIYTSGCKDSYIPNVGIVKADLALRGHVRRAKGHLIDIDHKWITPIRK